MSKHSFSRPTSCTKPYHIVTFTKWGALLDTLLDLTPLRMATFDDSSSIRQLLEIFLEDLPKRINSLNTEIETECCDKMSMNLCHMQESCASVGAKSLESLFCLIQAEIENGHWDEARTLLKRVRPEFRRLENLIRKNILCCN